MGWLIAAVAVVIILLAVPLCFRVGLQGEDRIKWQAEAVWMGGLVRISYCASGISCRVAGLSMNLARRGGIHAGALKKARPESVAARWRRISPPVRSAAFRLAREVWGSTGIMLKGSFRYGCEDPALTAWLHAGYCAAKAAGWFAGLTAAADFAWVGWRGRMEAAWSVRPLLIMAPVIRFLLVCAWQQVRRITTGGKRKWQVQA
jgi:hypothetical protein